MSEAPPACASRHVDTETGELTLATVRVYWVAPGAAPDDPALAEAELCRPCADDAAAPWARAGAIL